MPFEEGPMDAEIRITELERTVKRLYLLFGIMSYFS